MDGFLKMINGEWEVPDFDEELDEDLDDDFEGEFDEDFYESTLPGNMVFSAEYRSVSEIDAEKFLVNADIPYEVKIDAEFVRSLRKMCKMVSCDFDYQSYEGGKSVKESRRIDVSGFEYLFELSLSRADDSAPFVMVGKLERVEE
jgi:hypothetical protein